MHYEVNSLRVTNPFGAISLDLHALSTLPAFSLSQDQTLSLVPHSFPEGNKHRRAHSCLPAYIYQKDFAYNCAKKRSIIMVLVLANCECSISSGPPLPPSLSAFAKAMADKKLRRTSLRSAIKKEDTTPMHCGLFADFRRDAKIMSNLVVSTLSFFKDRIKDYMQWR